MKMHVRRAFGAVVFVSSLLGLPRFAASDALRDGLQEPESEHPTVVSPDVKIPVIVETHEPREAEAKTPARPTTTAEAKPTSSAAAATEQAVQVPDAATAMKLLIEGNARWVEGKPINPNTETERRQSLAADGQKPFVTVLTCADSRVPVERLFDRGVGDVFVLRVAGNVAGQNELGTIEYGVGHLHTPLLVVMGHSKCGAVNAAATKAEVHGNVAALVEQITPAVERARRINPTADNNEFMNAAIRENVWQTIFRVLKQSPEVREAVAEGKLRVVGAVCDIATGRVDWMGEHPWQSELLDGLKAPAHPGSAASAEKPEEH